MRQRSCQTDLHVARVPRGTRAMPVNEKPRVYTGAHKKVIQEITIMASVKRGW